MALSIGISAGAQIMVGDELLKVTKVVSHHEIVISFAGRTYTLRGAEKSEVAPEVFVFCGIGKNSDSQGARIAFEAPREIIISRVEPKS